MNAMLKKGLLWGMYAVIGIVIIVGSAIGGHYLFPAKAETPVVKEEPAKPAATPAADSIGVKAESTVKAGDKVSTEASALATVNGAMKAAAAKADLTISIDQGGKASDEDGTKKCSSTVYQKIDIHTGKDGRTFEEGETAKKRLEGQAKIEEIRAKHAARIAAFKPTPTPTAKVDVVVHGKVEVGSGKIEVGSGKIEVGSGRVEVGTGTVTVNGVTKTVTVRERYDACNRLISRTIDP